jgi:hypothetical protein
MRLVTQQASHSQLGSYLSGSLGDSSCLGAHENKRISKALICILSFFSFLIDGVFIDFVVILRMFSGFCGLSLLFISSPLTASHFFRRISFVSFFFALSRNLSSFVILFFYHSVLLVTLTSIMISFLSFRINLLSCQLRPLLSIFIQLCFKSLQLSFGRRNFITDQPCLLRNQEIVARLLQDVIMFLSSNDLLSSTAVNPSAVLKKSESLSSLTQINHYSDLLSKENIVTVGIQRLFSSCLAPFSACVDSDSVDVTSGLVAVVEQTMFYFCNIFHLFTSLVTLYILLVRLTRNVRNSFPSSVKLNTEEIVETVNPGVCHVRPLLSLKNSLKGKRIQLERLSDQLKELEFFLQANETLLLTLLFCSSSSSGFNNMVSVDDASKQLLLSELCRLSYCFDFQNNLLLQDLIDVPSYEVIDQNYQIFFSDLLGSRKSEKLTDLTSVEPLSGKVVVPSESSNGSLRNTLISLERSEYEEFHHFEESVSSTSNNKVIEKDIYNIYTGIANVDANLSSVRCKPLSEESNNSRKISNHLLHELKNVLQHQISSSKQQVRIKEFENDNENAASTVLKELSPEDLVIPSLLNGDSHLPDAGTQSIPVVSAESFVQMRSITTEFLSKLSHKINEEIVLE